MTKPKPGPILVRGGKSKIVPPKVAPASKSKVKPEQTFTGEGSNPVPPPTVINFNLVLDDASMREYSAIVSQLSPILATLSPLEKRKEELESRLHAIVADLGRVKLLDPHGDLPEVNCFTGSTTWIDRNRLLERGVDPDIIKYATMRKEYLRADVGWKKAGIKSLVELEGDDGESYVEDQEAG